MGKKISAIKENMYWSKGKSLELLFEDSVIVNIELSFISLTPQNLIDQQALENLCMQI